MDNEDFQRVNKEIEAEGEEPYANPRNLTSGTLRRLDPKIVAKRRLRFLAHGLGQVEPMPVTSYWEWTQLLRKWGLPLPKEVWRVESVDEAIKCIGEFDKIRKKLPYPANSTTTLEECVDAILDGFAKRKARFYIPKGVVLANFTKPLVNSVLMWPLIRRISGQQVRSLEADVEKLGRFQHAHVPLTDPENDPKS
jgi:hypothetical protein